MKVFELVGVGGGGRGGGWWVNASECNSKIFESPITLVWKVQFQ